MCPILLPANGLSIRGGVERRMPLWMVLDCTGPGRCLPRGCGGICHGIA